MLRAENVSYALRRKFLIEKITLAFRPGILYGILGPNGSGKSTFLKTASGIWRPTHGRILWNNQELLAKSRLEISRTVSLVPQNPQVHFDFSVKEMVRMGRYCFGNAPCDEKKIQAALETVDAWHLAKRSILHLSHGERKRVYIARALVTESPILLLDEPEAGLDICHQLEIWGLLRKLAQQQKTIIITNHDLAATRRFCDEIAVLNQGKCLSCGAYDKVMSSSCLEKVFGVKQASAASASCFERI